MPDRQPGRQTKAVWSRKALPRWPILAAEARSLRDQVRCRVLVGAVGVLTAVEKANYDFNRVDPASLTALKSPVKATAAKGDAYVRHKCGSTLNGK